MTSGKSDYKGLLNSQKPKRPVEIQAQRTARSVGSDGTEVLCTFSPDEHLKCLQGKYPTYALAQVLQTRPEKPDEVKYLFSTMLQNSGKWGWLVTCCPQTPFSYFHLSFGTMHSLVIIELDTHLFMYYLLCVLVSFLQGSLQISAPRIGPRQAYWLHMERRWQ